MKIGIYGGTYDPIHLAHTRVALKALEQFDLDELWLMPAKIPPHKDSQKVTSEFHRLNMLKIAVSELETKKIKVCEYELNKEGVSFSYLSLIELTRMHPEHEFYFIIGEDSLQDFYKWKHPEIISQLVKIIVAPRINSDLISTNTYIDTYRKMYKSKMYLLDFSILDISSTQIRSHVKNNENISEFVSIGVCDYIKKNKLYR